MRFSWVIEVTTDHTVTNKKVETLYVAHGILTHVSVIDPPGCSGLVHCVIRHREHQIFPSTERMSLSGDTFPIEWDDYYELYHEPYFLKAELWGVSCRYNHNVWIDIVILPRRALAPPSITEAIRGAFGMMLPKRIPVTEE
ncbi:unnamed protein product [marine sediment metagenome]|uniref:Uncharacterized protein n=1 Tax=marine sediment metagenome TaxID=412755 RepID=X1VI11_9ZZZZ